MDNKQIIASELAKVIDSLDQDAILNLLEQPKSSDLGDIALNMLGILVGTAIHQLPQFQTVIKKILR